MAVQAELRCR